jgi:hypothetical protein
MITDSYLARLAMIESSNNPFAVNENSGAKGLYQFIPSTAEAYGLDDPFDSDSSKEAAKKLSQDNYNYLKKKLGREPSEGELYLAHQQGMGGSTALLSNPDKKAVDVLAEVYDGNKARAKKAIKQNGGDVDMTAKDFANMWINKFEGKSEEKDTEQAQTDAIKERKEQEKLAELTASYPKVSSNIRSQLQGVESVEKEISDTYELSPEEMAEIETEFEQSSSYDLSPEEIAEIEAEFTESEEQIKPEENESPGFIDRMSRDISKRIKQSEEANMAETLPESMLQGAGTAAGLVGDVGGNVLTSAGRYIADADSVLGGYGANVLRSVGSGLSNLPSFGEGNLGENVSKDIDKLSKGYSAFRENSPRAAKNIEAAGNVLTLGVPAARYSDEIAEGAKLTKEAAENAYSPRSIEDIKKSSQKIYQEAQQSGGTFGDSFDLDVGIALDDTVRDIRYNNRNPLPKEKEALNYVDNLNKTILSGPNAQNLNFEELQRIDQQLSSLARDNIDDATKNPDYIGQKYIELQDNVRATIDDYIEKLPSEGEGYQKLKEARKEWNRYVKMQTINDMIERSDLKRKPISSLKTALGNLATDRKKARFFTDKEIAAMKKFSKDGALDKLLQATGSLLTPIVSLGTGNIGNAAISFGVKQGSDAIGDLYKYKSMRNLNSLIDTNQTFRQNSESVFSKRRLDRYGTGAKVLAPASVFDTIKPEEQEPLNSSVFVR